MTVTKGARRVITEAYRHAARYGYDSPEGLLAMYAYIVLADYDHVRAAFVKHRTVTHVLDRSDSRRCLTCMESDAILSEDDGRGDSD